MYVKFVIHSMDCYRTFNEIIKKSLFDGSETTYIFNKWL